MSILRPSTLAILRTVKPTAPLFSNMIVADLFEARHTIGALKILPTTVGGFVVFDTRAPNGAGVLDGPFATEDAAHAALERQAAPKSKRRKATKCKAARDVARGK